LAGLSALLQGSFEYSSKGREKAAEGFGYRLWGVPFFVGKNRPKYMT
jgi:hypothetical protein